MPVSTIKKAPPRYTPEFHRRAVTMVLVDKMPVSHVAKKLNCTQHSVSSWVKQYRDSVLPKPSSNVPFFPVQLMSSSDTTCQINTSCYEIITPNGFTLRFPSQTSVDSFVSLLRQLSAI